MRKILALLFSIFLFLPSIVSAEPGDSCGGFVGKQCGSAEWCNTGDNACGIGDAMGTCAKRPEVCTKMFMPVCGCDARTYGNECEAHANGVSVAYVGTCRAIDTSTCAQVISCGVKDGKMKEYPTPCDAAADGATDIVPREGSSCPVLQ